MSHLAFKRASSRAILPLALVAIALTLAGCGRRGSLEAPEGATGAAASTGRRPASRLTPGTARSTARQDPSSRDPLSQTSRGAQIDDDEPPIPAPKRPFILDPIL